MSKKRRLWLATPAFLSLAIASAALGFDYKSAKDFKTLEHFASVKAFEASYSALLDHRFDTEGTMYQLMRAGDAARIIAPMVKQRALMLKDELELASRPPMSKEDER